MGGRKYPVLSLFSGAGGLDLGFESVGFNPILALDIDPVAVDTYNWNRRDRRSPAQVADLSQESPSDLIARWVAVAGTDVLPVGIIGGPPCQAFSVSNVHRIENDPRAELPLKYAEILQAFNEHFALEFFVFENVAGLNNRTHASSLQKFLEAFSSAGFATKTFTLDAVDFGVPQVRKRMFIVGFNRERYPGILFSPPCGDQQQRTVRDAIGHLAEPVRFSRGIDPREFELHRNHWCLNPKSRKFTDGSLTPGKMLSRSFRVLEWDEPSWTVAYGNREVHVHPQGHRRLSVYEAMLLQSFPLEYELLGNLSDQIRLISDSVPPPVGSAIANEILAAFSRYEQDEYANRQLFTNGQAKQLGFLGEQTVAPISIRE